MSLQHTSPAPTTTTATATPSTASLLRLAAATESRALNLHPTSPALALTTLIAATEHYIAARRTSRAPQLLDKKIHDLLTRAERWKAVQTTRLAAENALANPETPGRPRRTPVLTGGDAVKEQTVLLKSSRVDGGVFPPWTGPPRKEEFSGESWTDPAGMLRLAEGQEEMLAGWRRAREVFGGVGGEGMGGRKVGRWDLTQDLVTDCSVVASLCAALRREEAGWGETVAGNVWPQDEEGRPVESENGKYVVRLWFNGCWRKVVIDDFLPAAKNERTLYVTCRNNPHVSLYALIEKAYLKVLGGYDFPGSNSGTDLLALTGWIPEHVFLQDDDMNADSLWRRMTTAWASGDLLITLGTGPMTRFEERTTGLVGEHDYAVLELKMEAGERRLLVKNPWSQATVWRGLGSDSSDGDFDRSPSPSPPSTFSTSSLADALPAAVEEPGTFWISLENTIRNFTSLYLNFSPSLFTHIHQTHLTYDLATKLSETCFLRNPQYTLTAPTATPVWVLLTRHTTTPTPGFIALYAFATSTRTILSSRPLARTPFLDSPQTLLRLDLPPNTPHTIVLATQHLPPAPTAFSLHLHSLAPLTITPPQDPHPYTLRLSAAWARATAGGPAHAEYAANPQFRISLARTSSLTFLLESASSHPLHIALYHSRGERVSRPTTRDIIAASGEYIKGAALCRVSNLAPGSYTAVTSTFERGQEGGFELAVMASDGDVRCEQLRAETAGCFCTVRGGEWGMGVREVEVELEVERLGAVWVRCRGGEARVVLRDGGEVVLGEGRGRTERGDLRSGVGGYRICVRREGGEREWEIEVVSEVAVWVGEDEEV